MIINHNIAAFNAVRQHQANSSAVSKSIEKISSGLRINRAADDAAGLAIREKMRGQIRGTEQASRNCQDGISLIQTADGGLNAIHDILQRMRELAVQSSNGIYLDEDRAKIGGEVDALKLEIDRIAKSTNFNGIYMLDKAGSNQVNGMDALGLLNWPTVTVGGNTSFSLAYNVGRGVPPLNLPDLTLTVTLDRDESGNWTVTLGGDLSSAGPVNVKPGQTDLYRDANGNFVTMQLSSSPTIFDIANSKTDPNVISGQVVYTLYTIDTDNANRAMSLSANAPWTTGTLNGVTSASAVLRGDEDVKYRDGSDIILQIGANTNQILAVSQFSLRCANIGLGDTNVASLKKANEAISDIDAAIDQVSSIRSYYGANQNRLEHTMNNLNNYSVNISAAESRVSDLNVARQTMDYVKQKLLMDSSQAMIATANSIPQNVLQILR